MLWVLSLYRNFIYPLFKLILMRTHNICVKGQQKQGTIHNWNVTNSEVQIGCVISFAISPLVGSNIKKCLTGENVLVKNLLNSILTKTTAH